jgi:hypothetical protein
MKAAPKSKSLVFVVGAGASNEVGMPLGSELALLITRALAIKNNGYSDSWAGSEKLVSAFRQLGGGQLLNSTVQVLADIREGLELSPSIDSFIHMHRDRPEIAEYGKLAIADRILAAEEQSRLRVDRDNVNNRIAFKNVEHTWFAQLRLLLTDGCHKDDLPARLQKVTIITFNYDRCIEHYLHGALAQLYRQKAEWATEVLKSLDIYHPYGSVGALPWSGEQPAVDFGLSPHQSHLISLSQKLLTFSEGVSADSGAVECIRNDLAHAERIAFLGFAYQSLNLDLLFDGRPNTITGDRGRPIYGTAVGISEPSIERIRSDIPHRTKRIHDRYYFRSDLTCAKLFHEYRLDLALP